MTRRNPRCPVLHLVGGVQRKSPNTRAFWQSPTHRPGGAHAGPRGPAVRPAEPPPRFRQRGLDRDRAALHAPRGRTRAHRALSPSPAGAFRSHRAGRRRRRASPRPGVATRAADLRAAAALQDRFPDSSVGPCVRHPRAVAARTGALDGAYRDPFDRLIAASALKMGRAPTSSDGPSDVPGGGADACGHSDWTLSVSGSPSRARAPTGSRCYCRFAPKAPAIPSRRKWPPTS